MSETENKVNLSTEMLMNLSMIVDKMEIANDLEKLEFQQGNMEELGTKLVVMFGTKMYKAKDEIYTFIADSKGITVDEAKKVDAIAFIKELFASYNIKDFLA